MKKILFTLLSFIILSCSSLSHNHSDEERAFHSKKGFVHSHIELEIDEEDSEFHFITDNGEEKYELKEVIKGKKYTFEFGDLEILENGDLILNIRGQRIEFFELTGTDKHNFGHENHEGHNH